MSEIYMDATFDTHSAINGIGVADNVTVIAIGIRAINP